MNFSLGLFQQGLIVTAFIAGLTALVSRIVFPLVQNKIKLFAPRQQANIILFVCFLPLLMVIYILAISYLPSLFHTWGFGPAHCGIHADTHSHLCAVHPPLPITHWLTWISTVFFLIFIASTFVLVGGFLRSYTFGRRINNAVRHPNKQNVCLVDSHIPFAFTTGLLNTKIIISTTLYQNLSKGQLDIVMAHEHAHRERHDILRQLLARTVSLLHFPALRKTLLSQLSLTSEKACDEAAALKLGSRVDIAETLVFIERLYQNNFNKVGFNKDGNVALGVVDNTVVPRVEALLRATKPQPFHSNWLFFALAFTATVLAINFGHVHRLVESILSYITH